MKVHKKVFSYKNMPVVLPGKTTIIAYLLLKVSTWAWYWNAMILVWAGVAWLYFILHMIFVDEEVVDIFDEKQKIL